jgi:hypothetical protein
VRLAGAGGGLRPHQAASESMMVQAAVAYLTGKTRAALWSLVVRAAGSVLRWPVRLRDLRPSLRVDPVSKIPFLPSVLLARQLHREASLLWICTEKLPHFSPLFRHFSALSLRKRKKNWMKQKNQFISSANTAAHGFS